MFARARLQLETPLWSVPHRHAAAAARAGHAHGSARPRRSERGDQRGPPGHRPRHLPGVPVLSPAAFTLGRSHQRGTSVENECPNRLDGAPGGGRVPRVLPEGMLGRLPAPGCSGAAAPAGSGQFGAALCRGTRSALQPLRVRTTLENVPSPRSRARRMPVGSGPRGASVSLQQPRGCRGATARHGLLHYVGDKHRRTPGMEQNE